MTAVRLRPARSRAEWDGLATSFPEHTRFHAWDFLWGEAASAGWRLDLLIAERDGVAIGAVPIAVERGGLRRTPHVQHPYHGPLVSAEDLPDLLVALRRERRRRGMARMTISFPPDAPGDRVAALRAAGWSVFVDRTYEVDLRSTVPVAVEEGVVMPFVSAGNRRRIRRALAKGVTVVAAETVDDLFLNAMEQAFESHGGRSRWTRESLPWLNGMIARGEAVALEAVHEGRRLGVVLRLRDGDQGFGWVGAVLPEGRPLGAAIVLYHEHLRLAAAEGMRRFDLLGHVDEGVGAFKRSMGAVERPFVEGTDAAAVFSLLRGAARRIDAVRRARATPVADRAPVAAAAE